MREEISEPQHWRSRPSTNPSWSTRRQAATMPLSAKPLSAEPLSAEPLSAEPLSAELVDAAFTDEEPLTASRLDAAEAEVDANTYPELIASLADQLAQLGAQCKQLQESLAETSDCQS